MALASSSSLRWRSALVLGISYAAFISLGLPDGLTSVAWPSIRASFSLPLDALGALVVTATLGYLLSSFSSGRVLARLGVGWLLALSCLATGISLLGYGLAPLWGVLVGLGLLAGLGAGSIDAGLNTYAAENFTPRTMNWLHAAFGVGAATGPLIMTGVLSAGHPWRLGYLIVGSMQLLLAGCFALTRRQWHAHSADMTEAPVASASLMGTLRLPAAWLSMLLFFLYTGFEFCTGQWLYTYLIAVRAVEPEIAGLWVSLYWGSLTVGRLLSGAIVARISVRVLLHLCMGGALLGVLLLWLAPAAWLSLAGVALIGFSLAPMFPSLISLTPARMGPAHAANTVGFEVSAAALGGAGIVGGFGLLAERQGLELLGPFLFATAVLLTGVFLLLEHSRRLAPGARHAPEQ